MKKIKLPLEMANGAMVRTIDELKENWDLEKVVEHFVTGKLTTWLNDRYYTDLAEKVENLPKDGDGRKLQQALCRVFEVPCEELELDIDEIAERKRRQDLLRQYTSDDEVLKNIDHVAFNQEDLAYLLDDEIAEIYLFNNKFTIPLDIEGKKYVGVGDNAVAEIRSKKPVNFAERGIEFSNVKFDEKYASIHKVVPEKPKFTAKVGDIIKLGEWHSDPIEWQVLEVKDGKALLLSKYALACRKYHNTYDSITWENCDLRKWLNGEFFQKAFKGDAAKCVVESDVPAHYNPNYSTDPGNDTKDKVFLLSVKEVLQYFKTDEERVCMPLPFVKSEGAYVDEDNGACRWWLRSPGSDAYVAAVVDDGGSVFSDGYTVHSYIFVVHSALWVDLSKM